MFLMPVGITPRRHKTIETTDILLQMVVSGRGVAALPRWLVEEFGRKLDVIPLRLGRRGIFKQIFLGARESDKDTDYLKAFIEHARLATQMQVAPSGEHAAARRRGAEQK